MQCKMPVSQFARKMQCVFDWMRRNKETLSFGKYIERISQFKHRICSPLTKHSIFAPMEILFDRTHVNSKQIKIVFYTCDLSPFNFQFPVWFSKGELFVFVQRAKWIQFLLIFFRLIVFRPFTFWLAALIDSIEIFWIALVVCHLFGLLNAFWLQFVVNHRHLNRLVGECAITQCHSVPYITFVEWCLQESEHLPLRIQWSGYGISFPTIFHRNNFDKYSIVRCVLCSGVWLVFWCLAFLSVPLFNSTWLLLPKTVRVRDLCHSLWCVYTVQPFPCAYMWNATALPFAV